MAATLELYDTLIFNVPVARLTNLLLSPADLGSVFLVPNLLLINELTTYLLDFLPISLIVTSSLLSLLSFADSLLLIAGDTEDKKLLIFSLLLLTKLSKPSLYNNSESILLDSFLLFILSEPLLIETLTYTISYQNDDSRPYPTALKYESILKADTCITSISSRSGELSLLNILGLMLNFTFLTLLTINSLILSQKFLLIRIDVSSLPKEKLLISLLSFDILGVISKDLLYEYLAF